MDGSQMETILLILLLLLPCSWRLAHHFTFTWLPQNFQGWGRTVFTRFGNLFFSFQKQLLVLSLQRFRTLVALKSSFERWIIGLFKDLNIPYKCYWRTQKKPSFMCRGKPVKLKLLNICIFFPFKNDGGRDFQGLSTWSRTNWSNPEQGYLSATVVL